MLQKVKPLASGTSLVFFLLKRFHMWHKEPLKCWVGDHKVACDFLVSGLYHSDLKKIIRSIF